MFVSAFPIISTPDLARALGFYRDLLDGVVAYQFPPDGDPDFVSLDIGTSHLGLGHDPSRPPDGRGRPFALWVYADDCDAAVERLRAAGVRIVEEPVDQPWGERVAHVEDPDGNTVIIGARQADSCLGEPACAPGAPRADPGRSAAQPPIGRWPDFLACFSTRFSFSVLPTFLVLCFCGDFSGMVGLLGRVGIGSDDGRRQAGLMA